MLQATFLYLGCMQAFISMGKNFFEIQTCRKIARELEYAWVVAPWLESYTSEISSLGALWATPSLMGALHWQPVFPPAWEGGRL